jgi:two-component sensor histidine kinase
VNNYSHQLLDRFKLAMIPSLLMAVVTNVYISLLILYSGEYIVLLSPIFGTVLFVALYLLLKGNRLTAKQTFYIGAYIVVAEVFVHTHFFGWESGFIYFLFLLPAVLLLNFDVKVWQISLFSISIVLAFIYLRFFHLPSRTPAILSRADSVTISNLNAMLTGTVFLVILIYFSRTIYKNDRMLLDVITDLELSNRRIGKQHEHQKVLLKEIHHRVKNNLQIISSLMSLQSRNLENEEVQDDKGNKVDFRSYLEEFVQSHRTLNFNIHFTLTSDDITLHLDCAVPIGLIISEIFTNAIKHAFDEVSNPALHVTISVDHSEIEVWIRDNGIGLPENFDIAAENLGLGTDLILSLTEQIDGKIQYYNEGGANFKINFQNHLTE